MAGTDTKKNVLFVSLGCDKNRVDSEQMMGQLAADFRFTNDEEDADVIVINTCSFIREAVEESIETILSFAARRQEGLCEALIVTGCLPERYKEEILSEIPEIDAIVGAHCRHRIGEVIRDTLAGNKGAHLEAAPEVEHTGQPRILTTGGHFAFLKIADGCDRHCTYCTIPSIRGPYRSMPLEELVAEAEQLAAGGVKELILVAQDTARYGVDLYGEKKLPELLRHLCRIEDLAWIRILYVYPEEIDEELICVMREEPKICHYLDMPIQHCSDNVLKRMGRKTDKARLEEVIHALRKAIPDIALRTTLITGFPGETEEEHSELVQFIRDMAFDRLGVFAYSEEEGTPAARMPDQVEEDIKESRLDALMRIQQEISEEKHRAKIGESVQVFVEGYLPEDEVWVGRTYADAPDVDGLFFLKSHRNLMSGDLVRARITGATEYDWTGEELCGAE